MNDKTREHRNAMEILRAGLNQLLKWCNNTISILGVLACFVSMFLLITFWLMYFTSEDSNQYLEFIGFLALPMIFLGGLGAIPVGYFWKRRRLRKKGKLERHSIAPDEKIIRVKGSIGVLLLVTVFVVLPVTAVTGYWGYHYTETTEFCGQLCHDVMKPQAYGHARSGHARVKCAECHIGAGASWFLKSKLSGLRQVYAVLTDSYHRPIPPAIEQLRPAHDTCEECHWPSKFFGSRYKENIHFSENEFNQRSTTKIMIKVGGSDSAKGREEGIHKEMLEAGTIEYRATDDKLQEIPWVKITRNDGDVSIFEAPPIAKEGGIAPKQRTLITRQIDCMDCHNRGAHHFRSPQISVNQELEAERIDPSLPFVKSIAVASLIEIYPDTPTALNAIEQKMTAFYKTDWPDIWRSKQTQIASAIERVKSLYLSDFFPEMKEDWRTYPENIGHQFSAGCFRCHDGKHKDHKGRVIPSDCENCHTFMKPVFGSDDEDTGQYTIGAFEHPNSLSVHKNVRCHTCHGSGKRPACVDCHKGEEWDKIKGQGLFKVKDEPTVDKEETYPIRVNDPAKDPESDEWKREDLLGKQGS